MDPRIIKAINYMIDKHDVATRKGTTIPYQTHPLGVMNVLLEEKAYDSRITTDAVIAGLLHDLNEDANISIETIQQDFGKEVSRLVANLSEPEELKRLPNQKDTWKQRKEHSLALLKDADILTTFIFCADKLDNARAIHRDVLLGEDVWSRFNASKTDVEWYYRSALSAMHQITGSRMHRLLAREIEGIFG